METGTIHFYLGTTRIAQLIQTDWLPLRIDPTGAPCLDLDEETPLPTELAVEKKVYNEFKVR
jgi:hypothetical protein